MITKEVVAEINKKLEELSNLCQKYELPVIAAVFSDELEDQTTLVIGGKNPDLSLMVAEVIASVVEDMKTIGDLKKFDSKQLLDMFLGDVSEHLEQYITNQDAQLPEVNNAIVHLGDKIEKEIDAKLRSILVGVDLTKELITEAKKAATEILANYSLDEKIMFDIKISPDGMAEVSFLSKKKAGGLH